MNRNSIEYVEKLTNKVFKQAEQGKIKFENDNIVPWVFHVKFFSENSSINCEAPIVIVRNKNVFLTNVLNYLKVAREFYESDKAYFDLTNESFDEKLFMDLIVNATNFDLNNIEKYIAKRTKMLQNQNIQRDEMILGNWQGGTIYAKIVKAKSNLEGPHCFQVLIKEKDEKFVLPSIYFGKDEDTINMYAIQAMRDKQENKIAKKMDRFFRKVNKGIDMEDEILSQVSPNALISMTIFMAYEKTQGVTSINACNFMPIRYNTNLTTGLLKHTEETDKAVFLEKHDKNQFNITNRFINTLIRYAHHFGYSYEYDDIQEKLKIEILSKEKITDGNIIYDIDQEIKKNIETSRECQVSY